MAAMSVRVLSSENSDTKEVKTHVQYFLRFGNKKLKLIIYLLSAISIGSSIVGYCRFSNNSHVIAYHAIPFFAAALSSIITIIMKFDLEDESMLFFKNRELLLFVVNIVFIISTLFVGHSNNIIVILIFRFIQGICIGFLSFITSIMISEVQKEYFKYYILSFGFGLCLGNIFLSKWPILSLSSSILQASLILICKPNKKSNVKNSNPTYELKMILASISMNLVESFPGNIIIIVSNKIESNLKAFYYSITFGISFAFGMFIFNKIQGTRDEDDCTILFYNYISYLCRFIAFLLIIHNVRGSLYLIYFCYGIGTFTFPWLHYFTQKYDGPGYLLIWGCFWFSNFISSLIYMCTSNYTLSIIGISITGSILICGIVKVLIHISKTSICSKISCDNTLIWSILLGFGGILIGTIIAPGHYESTINDPYGLWGKFSSYPSFFAFIGAFIAFINLCIDCITDTRVLVTIGNAMYILSTVLMNLQGVSMIVFKYFQSVAIGFVSILFPLMMAKMPKKYFYYSIHFYLLMIPAGMLVVSYTKELYTRFIHILPITYIILVWLSTLWEYRCHNIDIGNCSPYDFLVSLSGSFIKGFPCNSLCVYHYNEYGKYNAMIRLIFGFLFQILHCIIFFVISPNFARFYDALTAMYITGILIWMITIFVAYSLEDNDYAHFILIACNSFGVMQAPCLTAALTNAPGNVINHFLFIWF